MKDPIRNITQTPEQMKRTEAVLSTVLASLSLVKYVMHRNSNKPLSGA